MLEFKSNPGPGIQVIGIFLSEVQIGVILANPKSGQVILDGVITEIINLRRFGITGPCSEDFIREIAIDQITNRWFKRKRDA